MFSDLPKQHISSTRFVHNDNVFEMSIIFPALSLPLWCSPISHLMSRLVSTQIMDFHKTTPIAVCLCDSFIVSTFIRGKQHSKPDTLF